MRHWLEREWPKASFKLAVAHRGMTLAGGLSVAAEKRLSALMQQREIELIRECEVVSVTENHVVARSNLQVEADVVVWATGAVGADWIENLGLSQDERGFLKTKTNLSCVEDSRIFAVGDCGTIEGVCGSTGAGAVGESTAGHRWPKAVELSTSTSVFETGQRGRRDGDWRLRRSIVEGRLGLEVERPH